MNAGGNGGALAAVAWISGALAVGSAVLAVGHSGVRVPVVSALGPGGAEPVLPAAVAFSLAAGLHGVVAYGIARRRAWAWPLGLAVAGVTLAGAAAPFRGVGSLVGIVLAGAELGLLLTRRTRRAIMRPAS